MWVLYVAVGVLVVWLLARPRKRGRVPSPRATLASVEDAAAPARGPARGSPSAPRVGDRDAWEGSFWEVASPCKADARLRLDYVDGDGNTSRRSVHVRRFGEFDGTVLLIAHCKLRDATRTFRADRIRQCVDEDTGEVIADVPGHLRRQYDASPDRSLDRLFDDEFDVLRVLLFVGKADGQYRAAEKAIVRETATVLAGDSRLTDASIDEVLAELDVPTLQAFRLAVGRIAKRDQVARSTVLTAAARMVATQKTIHPAEQEALDYLARRLT